MPLPLSNWRSNRWRGNAGDLVWSVDPDTGDWVIAEVVRPHSGAYEGDIITLTIGGERIQATGNHPFLVLDGHEVGFRPFVEELEGVDACKLG